MHNKITNELFCEMQKSAFKEYYLLAMDATAAQTFLMFFENSLKI